jgi:hypothetical protein
MLQTRLEEVSLQEGARWREEQKALEAHLETQKLGAAQLLVKHGWADDFVTLPASPKPLIDEAKDADEEVEELALSSEVDVIQEAKTTHTDADDKQTEPAAEPEPAVEEAEPDVPALISRFKELTTSCADTEAAIGAACEHEAFERADGLQSEIDTMTVELESLQAQFTLLGVDPNSEVPSPAVAEVATEETAVSKVAVEETASSELPPASDITLNEQKQSAESETASLVTTNETETATPETEVVEEPAQEPQVEIKSESLLGAADPTESLLNIEDATEEVKSESLLGAADTTESLLNIEDATEGKSLLPPETTDLLNTQDGDLFSALNDESATGSSLFDALDNGSSLLDVLDGDAAADLNTE